MSHIWVLENVLGFASINMSDNQLLISTPTKALMLVEAGLILYSRWAAVLVPALQSIEHCLSFLNFRDSIDQIKLNKFSIN